MLRNLKAEMVRRGLDIADIAKTIKKSERTARAKLNGETDFTVTEALNIRDAHFPGMPLEELFKRVS